MSGESESAVDEVLNAINEVGAVDDDMARDLVMGLLTGSLAEACEVASRDRSALERLVTELADDEQAGNRQTDGAVA